MICSREIERPGIHDVLDAQRLQILSFAGAAGRGENLRPDLPGDLDGRQADAAGSGMDQHALAPLQLAQPAQGKLGGQEADGDRGRFLEAEMLGLGSDELGQRQRVTGEAGRGQRHDRVARLECSTPAPTAGSRRRTRRPAGRDRRGTGPARSARRGSSSPSHAPGFPPGRGPAAACHRPQRHVVELAARGDFEPVGLAVGDLQGAGVAMPQAPQPSHAALAAAVDHLVLALPRPELFDQLLGRVAPILRDRDRSACKPARDARPQSLAPGPRPAIGPGQAAAG